MNIYEYMIILLINDYMNRSKVMYLYNHMRSFGLFGTRAQIPRNELFNYLAVAIAIVRAIIYGFVKSSNKPHAKVGDCFVALSLQYIRTSIMFESEV